MRASLPRAHRVFGAQMRDRCVIIARVLNAFYGRWARHCYSPNSISLREQMLGPRRTRRKKVERVEQSDLNKEKEGS